MASTYVVTPDDVQEVWLRGLGIRFLVSGEQTDGRFALVEHPITPRSLAAPVHTHADEDEISYVVEGEIGVQIGEETFTAGPGSVVLKPRGVPHAFWNATDQPARVLELITPAGFERYFAEAATLFAGGGPPDPARVGPLFEKYRLQMDLSTVPDLMQAHDLRG